MRLFAIFPILSFVLATQAAPHPAPLSPAQLLPVDTLALVSIPDWDSAKAAWSSLPQSRLWNDPSLQPLREKLSRSWQDELGGTLERSLGLRLTDWKNFLHGQMTMALTPPASSNANASFGWLVLIETRNHESAVKAELANLKKKWNENGRPLRSQILQGKECTVLRVPHENIPSAASSSEGTPDSEGSGSSTGPPTESEILIAHSGSLVVLGNLSRDLERVLARQSGGIVPCLADQGNFQADQAAVFRGSAAFAWVDSGTLFARLQRQFSPPDGMGSPKSPLGLHWDRLLASSGLSAATTLAAQIQFSAEGAALEARLNVPAGQRRGLLALLAPEGKEAVPPGFVGSDVIKFKRWRIDGPKTWTTLESLLMSASPELSGVIQMGLEAAGKDRDPNYNLRPSLLESLGDDFMTIEKSATVSHPAPLLYMVGSPKPEQLVQALRAGSALLPLASDDPTVSEREFLGHKIYSIALGNGSSPTQLSFAATAGYAAITTDASMLEQFLREPESSPKPLRARPGLLEAADKVGGMSTGWFGYLNLGEFVRIWLENTRTQTAALNKLLALAPLAGGHALSADERKKMNDWWDPALLPPFEKISKYCSFAVYSLSSNSDGLRWRAFVPAPADLK